MEEVNAPSKTSVVPSRTSSAPWFSVIGWVTRNVPPSYMDMLPRGNVSARSSVASLVTDSPRKDVSLNSTPLSENAWTSAEDHLPSA